ncbi:unnamed protein product [Acanthosepion pharaonis]|uniref:Uncharacterized protein n=1 Tax=Acanthosepion pharaonis TaxID=158019 RepID=A0A812DQC7_ACAPH|nr:unnamed protein product [Sepia pharaonis]
MFEESLFEHCDWYQCSLFEPSFFDPFLWGQSAMYVDHPSSSIEDERESTTSEADPSLNIVHWRQSTMFEDNPSSNISAMYVDHPSSSIEDERESTTSEADPSLNIVHWRQSTMFEDNPSSNITILLRPLRTSENPNVRSRSFSEHCSLAPVDNVRRQPFFEHCDWYQCSLFEDRPSSTLFLWGQSAMYVDHPSSSIEDERESTTSEADPSLNIVHCSTMFEHLLTFRRPSFFDPFSLGPSAMYVDHPSSSIEDERNPQRRSRSFSEHCSLAPVDNVRRQPFFEHCYQSHFSKTVLLRPFSLGPVRNVLLTFRRPSFFDPFSLGQSTMYVDHPSSSIEDERRIHNVRSRSFSEHCSLAPVDNVRRQPFFEHCDWYQCSLFEDRPSSTLFSLGPVRNVRRPSFFVH